MAVPVVFFCQRDAKRFMDNIPQEWRVVGSRALRPGAELICKHGFIFGIKKGVIASLDGMQTIDI